MSTIKPKQSARRKSSSARISYEMLSTPGSGAYRLLLSDRIEKGEKLMEWEFLALLEVLTNKPKDCTSLKGEALLDAMKFNTHRDEAVTRIAKSMNGAESKVQTDRFRTNALGKSYKLPKADHRKLRGYAFALTHTKGKDAKEEIKSKMFALQDKIKVQ